MATAERVINRLNELAQFFPHGLEYKVAYETTSFVKASITDVVKTLLEAILLVFLVMYLFLQNFRATLIPTIAVPVVLMGTFAVLYACGYSINTLTMFAMVLAIGLLVDDAIVVVENVRAHHERGGPVATRGDPQIDGTNSGRAGGDRDGAVGGICADGLLRQAPPAPSIASSQSLSSRRWSLSVLVAMILTPALCATLLKPVKPGESHERKGFFGWFNRTFNRSASRYETFVGKILHRSLRWMLDLRRPARRDGVPVSAFADLVPAAGGSRDVHHLGPVAERQHPAADAEGGAEGGRLLPQ